VVAEGATVYEVSFDTSPRPLLRVTEEAFETLQERRDDWPAVMDDGDAVKEAIAGSDGEDDAAPIGPKKALTVELPVATVDCGVTSNSR